MSRVCPSAGQNLRLTLELDGLRFGLTPEDLFRLALRQNRQRAFLFVSPVLGKHIPQRPAALLAAGKLLSLAMEGTESPGRWTEVLRGADRTPFPALVEELEESQICLGAEERTLFVGFAETATGLARSAAACYRGECAYISTTRLDCPGRTAITFEESHSHAKTHRLYLDGQEPFAASCRRAVIIDDEFTTGSTALKLAEALHSRFGISRFVLLSLLDWTDGSLCQAMEARCGLQIRQVSLLHGAIGGVEAGEPPPAALDDWRGRGVGSEPLVLSESGLGTGRFLLSPAGQAEDREACRRLAQAIGPVEPDTLVLGTEELIYEPALIAGYLGAAAFHSSTQSPVYPLPGSGVENGACFDPPDCYSGAGYLYNVPKGRYSRAIVLGEEKTASPQALAQLADWLKWRGCARTEVVLL
ncbi:MAG: hypothetical protein HFF18_13155 [Oscillospiraceae bacterium]|nr:hypothetical protein [Oscillospiraceae bacterium]